MWLKATLAAVTPGGTHTGAGQQRTPGPPPTTCPDVLRPQASTLIAEVLEEHTSVRAAAPRQDLATPQASYKVWQDEHFAKEKFCTLHYSIGLAHRWHVRTKDNIARVRRDEAQAAEEENQRVLRAKLAEQESRTALLRTRARQNYDGGHSTTEDEAPLPKPSRAGRDTSTTTTTATAATPQIADIYTAEGNINFFKDIEEGKQTDGSNKEYEKEKKEEQEKYEKSIGYLTYLGQDSVEAQGKKAWYADTAGRITYKGDDGEEGGVLNEVGLKSKDKLDPIHDIIKYGGIKTFKKVQVTPKPAGVEDDVHVVTQVTQKQTTKSIKQIQKTKSAPVKKTSYKHKKSKKKNRKCKKKKRSGHESDDEEKRDRHKQRGHKRRRDDSSDDDDDSSRKRRKTSNHKSKSEEREQKRKKYHSSSSDSSSSSAYESSEDEGAIQEKKKKLEMLRAERLKREAEERKRANRLLAGKKPDGSDEPPKQPVVQQKYHSQFNPLLARQNQEQRPLEAGVKYWLQ
ncbi:Leukocyte receptor cluster member 1 [Chionoecetes opilio]|uniref:Leukocyte receptor cluster member 1 n=1 Tax=Chionoecetes opilio TaxID=41210 RepID=A0A8J8WBG4_CHIOP|nr:Leukocyte receptor cluster member 1 [Chionoecetes opilio]